MLDALERLHNIGYIYNDLKLDNVMVGTGSLETAHLIKLIDFGLATRYLDAEGNHISNEKRE